MRQLSHISCTKFFPNLSSGLELQQADRQIAWPPNEMFVVALSTEAPTDYNTV
jgi:hypothetical protein